MTGSDLTWEPRNVLRAVEAAGITFWSWNVDTDAIAMDARAYELWGVEFGPDLKFEDLSAHIHPADRDRVRAAFKSTRAVAGPFELDFRILVGEQLKWVCARGQGDDAGIVERVMVGAFLDVTSRKQAEESRELLAGEMSHRVKNLLAIAAGLTNITSRSTTSVEEMAHELTERLTALNRAHDLVRPVPGQTLAPAALLGDLLSVLLAPYDDLGAFKGRVRVAVPRITVGEKSTMILAMVIHELATNSLKHGALSVETGTIDVSSDAHDAPVTIVWSEAGGPALDDAPSEEGFGTKLIERSVTGHLQGSIDYDWADAGLNVTLRLDPKRLSE